MCDVVSLSPNVTNLLCYSRCCLCDADGDFVFENTRNIVILFKFNFKFGNFHACLSSLVFYLLFLSFFSLRVVKQVQIKYSNFVISLLLCEIPDYNEYRLFFLSFLPSFTPKIRSSKIYSIAITTSNYVLSLSYNT